MHSGAIRRIDDQRRSRSLVIVRKENSFLVINDTLTVHFLVDPSIPGSQFEIVIESHISRDSIITFTMSPFFSMLA
jgi:hypothetical protein